MTNDGTNRTRFIPVFPASCPLYVCSSVYVTSCEALTVIGLFSVTSVGATHHVEPEVAVSRFFSGGGFSDYVRRVYGIGQDSH